jgi:peptide-methionine (S)-S-oxide reductase
MAMQKMGFAIIIMVMLSSTLVYSDSKTDEAALSKATFAGGCFWCMEPPFDKLDGVISTTSGYIGGAEKDPTYTEVSAGLTGHAEARQFCDHGRQYRTGIFYHDAEQQKLAEASKQQVERTKSFDGDIYTEITAATEFYPAEDYHQDYYQKNPIRYKFYRYSCGRDQRLKELWGDRHSS